MKKQATPFHLFHLRIKALLLNNEFRNFCAHHDIVGVECDILDAWRDFPAWAEMHKADYCQIALLFYGNIFRNSLGSTRVHFKNAVESAHIAMKPFPLKSKKAINRFYQIYQGTPAPHNFITVSFDPALKHSDLIKRFKRFLTKRGKRKSAALLPPLSGYFGHQPKAKLDAVARFLAAATHAAKAKETVQKTGRERMPSLYKDFPGNAESKRKIIHKDVQRGENVAYWALRGIFPKSSAPPK
jgi:hypothetical protein